MTIIQPTLGMLNKLGGGFPNKSDFALGDYLNTLAESATIRTFHASIVSPSSAKSPAAKDPTPVEVNALLLLSFTLNTDAAFRQFKIPSYFIGNAAMHVHWTKTANNDESGKVARWRVSYLVFNGSSEDAAAAPTVVEVEDTYDDAGAGTRIVYRTPDTALVNFVAGRYVALKVEAVTPVGVAMASEPGLFSVDLTWDEYINQ